MPPFRTYVGKPKAVGFEKRRPRATTLHNRATDAVARQKLKRELRGRGRTDKLGNIG
jgi:hypothetical protein